MRWCRGVAAALLVSVPLLPELHAGPIAEYLEDAGLGRHGASFEAVASKQTLDLDALQALCERQVRIGPSSLELVKNIGASQEQAGDSVSTLGAGLGAQGKGEYTCARALSLSCHSLTHARTGEQSGRGTWGARKRGKDATRRACGCENGFVQQLGSG